MTPGVGADVGTPPFSGFSHDSTRLFSSSWTAPFTNNPAGDTVPAWSPDGTKIAFDSDRDGNFQVYVMDADGSNQTRLTNNPAGDTVPAWSPVG